MDALVVGLKAAALAAAEIERMHHEIILLRWSVVLLALVVVLLAAQIVRKR